MLPALEGSSFALLTPDQISGEENGGTEAKLLHAVIGKARNEEPPEPVWHKHVEELPGPPLTLYVSPGNGGVARAGRTLEQAQQIAGQIQGGKVRLDLHLDLGREVGVEELAESQVGWMAKDSEIGFQTLGGHFIPLEAPQPDRATFYRTPHPDRPSEESNVGRYRVKSKLAKARGVFKNLLDQSKLFLPPIIGTLAFGPIGGFAGAGLSTALGFFSQKELGPKARFVASAMVLTVAAGTAGISALIGLSGLKALSLVGYMGVSSLFQGRGAMPQIKASRFALPYQQAVQKALDQAGSQVKLAQAPDEEISPDAMIARAMKAASKELSVEQALKLAYQVTDELVNFEDIDELEAKYGGKGIYPIDNGPIAHATLSRIRIPGGMAQDRAAWDFVVGHEQSHIENRDMLRFFGQSALENALMETGGQSGFLGAISAIRLSRKLSRESKRQSRQREAQCDVAGVNFALAQGHKPQEIMDAAERMFSSGYRGGATGSHPADKDRLQAIRQQLGL